MHNDSDFVETDKDFLGFDLASRYPGFRGMLFTSFDPLLALSLSLTFILIHLTFIYHNYQIHSVISFTLNAFEKVFANRQTKIFLLCRQCFRNKVYTQLLHQCNQSATMASSLDTFEWFGVHSKALTQSNALCLLSGRDFRGA